MSEELNHQQLYVVGQIYNVVAAALPSEGIDYTVTVTFPSGDSSKPQVNLKGLTVIGKQFVVHCSEQIKKRLVN